jgi:PPOX class probable F420-dependent enzyme
MSTTNASPQNPMSRERMEEFLAQPWIAVLSWLTPKGTVASSPVWYAYRDGKFWVSSSSVFSKVRSMAKHPQVSLCIQDPTPPYRYVTVGATAVVRADAAAGRALDEQLALRYLGPKAARYYIEKIAPNYPGEPRLVELTPTHVSTMDGPPA